MLVEVGVVGGERDRRFSPVVVIAGDGGEGAAASGGRRGRGGGKVICF